MKATELMLNDIVDNYGEPFKVVGLADNERPIKVEGLDGRMAYWTTADEIFRETLFERYLENNGFRTTAANTRRWCLYDEEGCAYFELRRISPDGRGYEWGFVTKYTLVKIHYVHELQHVLRLCGLRDLADNFKI